MKVPSNLTQDRSEEFVQQLQRFSRSPKDCLSILEGFRRFVASQADGKDVCRAAVERWLKKRARRWSFRKLLECYRLVERFLGWMVEKGHLSTNPCEDLKARYGQRGTAPVVRALLNPDFEAALDALQPVPRFGSFIGAVMREHVVLMQSMGYRYNTQEYRLLRLDRFLQGRPDLAGQPLPVLIREWASTRSTPQQALECHLTGRTLSRALSRINPTVETIPWDRRIKQAAHQRHRRPYVFSEREVHNLLAIALSDPCPKSPLRPRTAHMMLVLAYCAGLRIGEIVRLNLEDFELENRTIEVRGTKFFKSRRLPLTDSVVAALQSFLCARKQAGGPTAPESALFWYPGAAGRYSRTMTWRLLVHVLRIAGLKPDRGRLGPRVHDFRHAFVVNRLLAWYREGVNPQPRLQYLATYLGHKDINSTLVYLTITQELLQQANAKFHVLGAGVLGAAKVEGDK